MIEWGMYILPFGLCSLIAAQVSKMGMQIIFAMGGFITVCIISSVVILGINNFLLARAAGVSYFKAIKALREAFIISFATSNVFAAIPSSLLGLQQELKLDPDRTNLVIPFGATLCNAGAIIYFVASSIFFCYIYEISPLTGNAAMIIVFGSVVASIGTAGGGAGIYGLLAVLFDPLDLPLQVALPVLLAVDRFVFPILTLADTHMNCTISAILSDLAHPDEAETKEDISETAAIVQ
jgi:proton glutamate symport protein